MRVLCTFAIACLLLSAAPGSSQQLRGLGLPLLVDVPTPPSAVRAAGEFLLVYELHLTNTGAKPVTLTRVEALEGDELVAVLEGEKLAAAIKQTAADAALPQTLASGAHAVVLLWLPLAALPDTLRHRVTGAGAAETEPATVEHAALAVRFAPLRIGPPLKGGPWLAANGPANSTHHRRSWLTHDGRPYFPERFAIDFVLLKDDDIVRGDPTTNASYHGYGADVIAVADATVVAINDGVLDNVPANRAPAELTLETIGGNTVTLDLGNGFFASYAHLKPGSIRVRPGQRVRSGELIGLLGNSGNSNAPHLHFQVGSNATLLFGDGVPYEFDSFIYEGAARTDEIPLNNWSVTFR
jgi:murein DD-endopeptidase